MNDYRKQLEAAIRATMFHSPTAYSWLGKQFQHLSPVVRRVLTPTSARNYLLYNLQFQLYNDFYCRGFAAPGEQEGADSPLASMTPFVEELSAANSGRGFWESGWEVLASGDGEVVVYKAGLELRARLEDCLVPEGSLIAPNYSGKC